MQFETFFSIFLEKFLSINILKEKRLPLSLPKRSSEVDSKIQSYDFPDRPTPRELSRQPYIHETAYHLPLPSNQDNKHRSAQAFRVCPFLFQLLLYSAHRREFPHE